MKAKSNALSKLEVVQFVLPEHLNSMGNMHGGEIMKLMDNTAGLVFMRHAEGKAVTAGVNDLSMMKSIPGGSIVKCVAEIVSTGTTSMKVWVEVFIEDVESGESTKAAEGLFTGVAISEEGKPRPVAPIKEKGKLEKLCM